MQAKLATNFGLRDGVDPMQGVILPKGRASAETYAYSLTEIRQTLLRLPLLAKALFAVASYAGLREAELAGLEWTDYEPDLGSTDRGGTISINRTIWHGHTSAPKSQASADFVPVIPQLRAILDAYRTSLGEPEAGPIFPVDIEKIGLRQIRPITESLGFSWAGWHACRRGIASNL